MQMNFSDPSWFVCLFVCDKFLMCELQMMPSEDIYKYDIC